MLTKEPRFILEGWGIEADALRLIAPDGCEHPLGERALRVLQALCKAGGQVVPKAQLIDDAWENLSVTENSLNQAIKEIRVALGDDASHPRFIETIRGRGFRLLMDVRVPDVAASSLNEPPRRFGRDMPRPARFIAVGVILTLVTGLAYLFLSSTASDLKPIAARSPDGTFIAVLTNQQNSTALDVSHLGTDLQVARLDFPKIESPALAWSPLSNQVAIHATPQGAAKGNYDIRILSMEGLKDRSIHLTKKTSGQSRSVDTEYAAQTGSGVGLPVIKADDQANWYKLRLDSGELRFEIKNDEMKSMRWLDD